MAPDTVEEGFEGEKQPPIKVLHCLGWATHGGVEQLRVLLAEGLKSSDYEHALICQTATQDMREKLTGCGWQVFEIGEAKNILDLKWFRRALAIAGKFSPDLIHGAVFEGNALAVACGIGRPKVPVILEEQSDGRGRTKKATVLLRLMAKLSTHVVGVAPQIVDYLSRDVKIPQKKLRLLNNGARRHPQSHARVRSSIRESLGISEDSVVIGSVGRFLEDHKRFSELIKMAPRLLDQRMDIHVLLIGEGSDRPHYEQLVTELNLTKRVHLPGFSQEVNHWLDVMDIFVLPSSGEALPLALVEALHAGLPCVATKVGGNPFVLDRGNVGLLVDPGATEDLIEAVALLVRNPAMRNRLSRLGQQRAAEEFSPERYVDAVESLWRESLK